MPNGIVRGQFFGLPYATLTLLMTQYQQVLTDIAVAGQSHAITGRTFTQANIKDVNDTIQELQAAINRSNGTRVRRTFAYGGGFTR